MNMIGATLEINIFEASRYILCTEIIHDQRIYYFLYYVPYTYV